MDDNEIRTIGTSARESVVVNGRPVALTLADGFLRIGDGILRLAIVAEKIHAAREEEREWDRKRWERRDAESQVAPNNEATGKRDPT